MSSYLCVGIGFLLLYLRSLRLLILNHTHQSLREEALVLATGLQHTMTSLKEPFLEDCPEVLVSLLLTPRPWVKGVVFEKGFGRLFDSRFIYSHWTAAVKVEDPHAVSTKIV